MKGIAKFYTWFWIIYYPVCIAFTTIVNFDYSDELLTILLVLYAVSKSSSLRISHRRIKEMKICAGIFAFYLVYSFLLQINTEKAVILDVMQEARPYLIFYLTWILAPEFNKYQKKRIIAIMLLSLFTYIALYFIRPDLLLLSAGSETAILGQLAINTAMIFYLFSQKTKRNLFIVVLILLLGLISGKSKYIGEFVAFIALLFYVKRKIQFNSPKIIFQVSALAAVVIFFTWTKFNAYYVEGFEQENSDKARPETYKTSLKILIDYAPFGSGFGTFGCAAAAKEYSPLYYKYELNTIWGLTPENPMFLADTFYPIYIAQFGFFGIILFFIFWKRRLKEANAIPNLVYYRMALMCIMALALEQTADSSYLSGKGMGYFMILALCLNSNRFMFSRGGKEITQNNSVEFANSSNKPYQNKEYRRY